MKTHETYTAKFKRDGVQLANSSDNVSRTARDLGIDLSGLGKWKKVTLEGGERPFPGYGRQNLTPCQRG